MIIGHGDIGTALKEVDRDDILFFASGVSNSKEVKEEEYQMEEQALLKQPRNAHLVYFSSLSVFYANTRYAQHKRHMEKVIKSKFKLHTIIRLGNIDWGDNPNTIINYLRSQYMQKKPLEIQDVYRYVISKEEFLHWMRLIPKWSCQMNLPGRMLKVSDIVKEYVERN